MTLSNKRASYAGVGHDGKKLATVPDAPGMHTPAMGADAFTGATVHPGNIARDGAKKVHDVVVPHGGMTSQQRAGHGAGGLGHATSPAVNDEPLSLDPTVSKNLTPPKASPGMRTR